MGVANQVRWADLLSARDRVMNLINTHDKFAKEIAEAYPAVQKNSNDTRHKNTLEEKLTGFKTTVERDYHAKKNIFHETTTIGQYLAKLKGKNPGEASYALAYFQGVPEIPQDELVLPEYLRGFIGAVFGRPDLTTFYPRFVRRSTHHERSGANL